MRHIILGSGNTILLAAATTTALMTGLFFAFFCSVNPGLARLPDQTYLAAMQSINRAIQNPLFALIFIGAPLFLMISTIMQYGQPLNIRFWLLLSATLMYLCGSLAITIFGNLPLNAALESCNLSSASIEEMHRLRVRFQGPWNFLHAIRTFSSIISLILLLLSFFLTSFSTLTPATPQCSHISAEVSCVPPSKLYQPAALISKIKSHKPAVWIVKMVGMRFVPRIIEIAAGDSVKWVNESNAYHNAVSADGIFISEMLKNGASWQKPFDQPGTFKYYCQPHRWMGMKGQVIVK